MGIPFIGFSSETLSKQATAKAGDEIRCDKCSGGHKLEPDDDGVSILLFYKCGDQAYVGAVNGQCIVGIKSDVSGKL
jgi:hypothetical protein